MQKINKNYRNTVSKDGGITAHIPPLTAERVRKYCRQQDIAVGEFIEMCVNSELDVIERDALNSMPKEMLIELLLAKKN